MRKILYHLVVLLLALPFYLAADDISPEEAGGEQVVPVKDLLSNKARLLGILGKELGQLCVVQCSVVEKSRPRLGAPIIYQLKISAIDGNEVDIAVAFDFVVETIVGVKVRNNEPQFKDMIRDMKKSGGGLKYDDDRAVLYSLPVVPATELEELEENYVGSVHELVVIESGEFVGYPKGLPKDVFVNDVSLPDFVYHPFLVVLAER